jgi:hypothetical protein
LHSSPKIRDISEYVLTFATINCWWSNASINLNNLLRQMMSTRRNADTNEAIEAKFNYANVTTNVIDEIIAVEEIIEVD